MHRAILKFFNCWFCAMYLGTCRESLCRLCPLCLLVWNAFIIWSFCNSLSVCHSAILSFCHCAILLFCQSVLSSLGPSVILLILSICHCAILSLCHSVILIWFNSGIESFYHSVMMPLSVFWALSCSRLGDLDSLILVQISLDYQVERGGPVKADAVGPLGHDQQPRLLLYS